MFNHVSYRTMSAAYHPPLAWPGMLYKEALQTSTIEEQTEQIDQLTAELSAAKALAPPLV